MHEKAWRHLHVKRHEADMIDNEALLWRSELFGEANRSAHPDAEPMDVRRRHRRLCSAESFSEDSEASEDVAACEHAELTVGAKDEAATSADAPSACPGEIEATEQEELASMRLRAAGLFTKPPLAFAQDKKVGP